MPAGRRPSSPFVYPNHIHQVLYAPRQPPPATITMAAPQYSFAPPPPPPGNHQPAPYNPHNPSHGYQPPVAYPQPGRGGGAPRGGDRGGRGGFNGAPQANGYNVPQGPPQQQRVPSVQYGQQPPAPYIGPQAGPQGPLNGQPSYPPPQQWQQHGQPQVHHQGPPQQHLQQGHPQQHGPPHPAPLSAQNYHPNFAPQAYNPQQPQFAGPQQPPQYQQPPPVQYGPPHTPHQAGPQQWPPPQQQQQQPPHFSGGRGGSRGRGGFSGGRGAHEQAPLMGPPIRMGFDMSRGNQPAQASNGFPPNFANQQSPSGPPFSQPAYGRFQGPPPSFSHGGSRAPLDPNPFHASGPNRGRGGFRGRGGGRGDFHSRGRDHHSSNRQFSNGPSSSSAQSDRKSAVADNNHAKKKKKQRRTNTLGLTPNGADHEESDEEDDLDEEARLVTLLGPDTPQLPTDLENWLAERKSRYPTKARKDAAEEEIRKRREHEEAKVRKEAEERASRKQNETKLERQQRKAEKLRLDLEKAERKIQNAMSGGKRKRDDGDVGDGEENAGQVSDAESDSSDSDSDPETMSSRKSGLPVSQLPKAQLQRHCKYFSTGGTCGKKGKCRFVHDQEVRNQALRDKEANGGKMTLAQRLILNDTAKDDLTILKSIKYLKEKGLMTEAAGITASASNGTKHEEEEIKHEEIDDYNDDSVLYGEV